MKLFIHCTALASCMLTSVTTHAAELPGIPLFVDEMVQKHHFNRDELNTLFDRAEVKPKIIEAISRPSTARPWPLYRASFVNENRIKPGLQFWKQYRQPLMRAEKKYGVPQQIIVALIGVETLYGKNAGDFRTLDALTTLAFDYPRRADFFRDELENYLLLAREQQFDLLGVKGSYAGALGIPQFMPSSYRKYAVDFNGNHKIDIMNEPVDAIGSIGNYMKGYGWIKGGPVAMRVHPATDITADGTHHSVKEWETLGVSAKINSHLDARLLDYTVESGREYWLGFNNFDVITRYNNSDYYAMSVFELAEALNSAMTNKRGKKSPKKLSKKQAKKH